MDTLFPHNISYWTTYNSTSKTGFMKVYESVQSRIRGKSFFFMFIIPDMELELERIVLARTLNMTSFT